MPTILSCQLEHSSACAYLRIFSPLSRLAINSTFNLKFAASIVNGESRMLLDSSEVDVAVFQRHFKLERCGEFFYALQVKGVPIIFDVDDNLIDLPNSHPDKIVFDELEEHTLTLMQLADVVTVSTENLKNLYLPFVENIEIVPNCISSELWQRDCRWSQDGKIRIGFAGSATHVDDLLMIEKAIKTLMQEYSATCEWHFWGCCPESWRNLDNVYFHLKESVSYEEYVKKIQEADLDIALAPLCDSVFNQAKSSVKWQEYSIGSIPALYSKIPSYEEVVVDAVDGFLCDSDNDSWYQALKKLIDDKDLRQKMGRLSREKVVKDHLLSKMSDRWQHLLESLKPAKAPEELPLISVIIPVFNRSELTEQCLNSIFKFGSSLNFEVIVVDNNSTDNTKEILKKFESQIRVLRFNKNSGYAKANNRAADIGRGQFFVMLNNDTEVEEGWLEALLNCQQETGASLVGARLFYPDGGVQHAGIALYPDDDKPHVIYSGLSRDHKDIEKLTGIRRPFQIVTAACWLITRKSWQDLKGFDEAYINGYEDVDLCLRLGEMGRSIMYEPRCVVIHHESQSPGRALHTAHNEKLLFDSWRGRWQHDLDLYLHEDGMNFDSETGFSPRKDFDVLGNNLKVLLQKNNELGQVIWNHREGWGRRRCEVLEGPSLKMLNAEGAKVLHSRRDPRKEAKRWVQTFLKEGQEPEVVRVFGFAMGYHVEEILAKVPPTTRVEVQILDNLVFRLALETRDLTELLKDDRLVFVKSLEKADFILPAYMQMLSEQSKKNN